MAGFNTLKRRMDPDGLSLVEQAILRDYDAKVSFEDGRTLRKFGKAIVGTSVSDVWATGGTEVLYDLSNPIDTIVSTAADPQPVVIVGHTAGFGKLTRFEQEVTLNGTTPVPLPIPLAHVERLYNNDDTAASGADFAGTVTVYNSSFPRDHLTVVGTHNQSLKSNFCVDQYHYLAITGVHVAVLKATAAVVDFDLKTREIFKVWRTREIYAASRDSGAVHIDLDPPLIVPPNHYVKMTAVSSAVNTEVDATIEGYFAKIQS